MSLTAATRTGPPNDGGTDDRNRRRRRPQIESAQGPGPARQPRLTAPGDDRDILTRPLRVLWRHAERLEPGYELVDQRLCPGAVSGGEHHVEVSRSRVASEGVSLLELVEIGETVGYRIAAMPIGR
jgi:hypothetical protein